MVLLHGVEQSKALHSPCKFMKTLKGRCHGNRLTRAELGTAVFDTSAFFICTGMSLCPKTSVL